MVPNIGHVHARLLAQHFGSAWAVFEASRSQLEKIEGIGTVRAGSIKSFTNYKEAESEIDFIEKYQIKPLFITDKEYPQRLLHCYDAPALLFYKGQANLNASRIVAIVGTRNHTDYGKQVTEKLVKELSAAGIVLVSGLAYGIDGIAHKCSLKYDIPTIGVVGHGLDQIYPPGHSGLAKEMLKQGGGLLTEFRSKTQPDKHNFPGRNRIVAGISDATILVETGIKGGSMITAEIANSYNRDVFAVPGKITDSKSEGCNHLIKTNKAILLTDASEFTEIMGWQARTVSNKQHQHALFLQLTEDERIVVDILKEHETIHLNELNLKSGLSTSAVAAALLNLELNGVIRSLPGKMYRLE
ncbi:MAG TPA: DNA-processing protein DprA [Chitinophagaceae bacterium]